MISWSIQINEDLVDRHVPSLLYETPGEPDSEELLGSAMYQAALAKIQKGSEPVRTGRWRPHFGLNIRGGGAGMYRLMEGSTEVGTLSGHQQFKEAYQRAIYLHGGRSYRVVEISLTGDGGEIQLERTDSWRRTNAAIFTAVSDADIFDAFRYSLDDCQVDIFYGKVTIMESLNSVREVDERSGEIIDQWVPQANSAQFSNAHAFWIQGQQSVEASVEALAAFQQLLRVGALFSVPLDAHDIFPHGVAKEQKAYIVESYPGGIGVAKKMLERWCSVLAVGIKIAEDCECSSGCPNCIVPPRATDSVDKVAGVRFASSLLHMADQKPNYRFRNGFWEPTS